MGKRRGTGHGSSNSKWKGGKHLSDKGYHRISAGPHRNKYEHRVVMEKLLGNPVGLIYIGNGGKIPEGMDVHHVDYDRRHNCEGNLMLISHGIHSALSNSYKTYVLEHWEEYTKSVAESNRWE